MSDGLGSPTALNLRISRKPTAKIGLDTLANGHVIVVWVERPPRFPGSGSIYRIDDETRRAVTGKTEFRDWGQDSYMSVQVTALAGGGFCSTFAEYRNGVGQSFVQVYAVDGATTGPAFRMIAADSPGAGSFVL